MIRIIVATTGVFLLSAVVPAFSRPIPDSAYNKAAQAVMDGWGAAGTGMKDTYSEATKYCRDAEKMIAGFDRDPFIEGLIASCFATVEHHKGTKKSACNYYLRAIQNFEIVPTAHKEFKQANGMADSMRKDRKEVGCGN